MGEKGGVSVFGVGRGGEWEGVNFDEG